MNSNIRSKIEKFIDSHGSDLVLKVQKKRKHQSISKSTPTESPSSINSEEKTAKLSSNTNGWEAEIPPSPVLQTGDLTTAEEYKENTIEKYPRRSYYARPRNSYYRYRSPSPYYRNRYYYHRRGSLSDDERRWD